MSSSYKTIVTSKGAEYIAAALLPNGEKLKITHFAVGDGNGSTPTPDTNQTALVHEVYRGSVSNIYIDTEDTTRIIVEGIIPADQGGFWVREIGLYNTQGELVVVGNAPEGYKPLPSEGAARVLTCQVFVVVSNTDAIELKVAGDAFLPDATTEKRGVVKLNSSLDSDSETEAATPKAVKRLKELQDAITNNYLAVTTRFANTQINRLINDLKITDAGLYKGLYRYLNKNGGINWYFLFLALCESDGKVFTLNERVLIAERAMRVGLVVPFEERRNYAAGQRIIIDGTIFMVTVGGTTGSIPSITSVAVGGTIVSGNATLENLGKPARTIPDGWAWFFADISTDLQSPVAPDSNDSYAALYVASIALFADSRWLNGSSGIAGHSRYDVIKNIVDYNLTRSFSEDKKLVAVFQGNKAPGGNSYTMYFCQDNAEAYSGYNALRKLALLKGDRNTYLDAEKRLAALKEGILSLYDDSHQRFRTYYGEVDWTPTPSDNRFVKKDRFSVAPWRFGVLDTNGEIVTYGIPVLNKIITDYPAYFVDDIQGIDAFAISDFFAWVAKATGSDTAAMIAVRRVQARQQNGNTITDLATAASVCAWGSIGIPTLDNFAYINGESVVGNARIEVRKQSDIYDRTSNVTALPGAFGFGALINTYKQFSGSAGNQEFLSWVTGLTPGRYYAVQSSGSDAIIPGVVFSGLVEIIYTDTVRSPSGPQYESKLVFFYGVNGDLYVNRYQSGNKPRFIGWVNLKVDADAINRNIAAKAPLSSPKFTDKPTAPTASESDNSQQIANTEFVVRALSKISLPQNPDMIPSTRGYGTFFSGIKEFSGSTTVLDFVLWVKDQLPGRYYIHQERSSDQAPVIPGVYVDGFIEVCCPASATSDSHVNFDKLITYHGIDGAIYRTRYIADPGNPQISGWRKEASIEAMYETTGSYGSPVAGGLIFAAYFGTSDTDSSRKLKRGDRVPGSRLGMVTINAKASNSGSYASTPQFITVSPNSYQQPGMYVALSGSHLTTLGKDECFVGLFMRVL